MHVILLLPAYACQEISLPDGHSGEPRRLDPCAERFGSVVERLPCRVDQSEECSVWVVVFCSDGRVVRGCEFCSWCRAHNLFQHWKLLRG